MASAGCKASMDVNGSYGVMAFWQRAACANVGRKRSSPVITLDGSRCKGLNVHGW